MKSESKILYLKEQIRRWDSDSPRNSFTTVEFLRWVKEKPCPQWMKYSGVRRLTAYLNILRNIGFLSYKNGVWKVESKPA